MVTGPLEQLVATWREWMREGRIDEIRRERILGDAGVALDPDDRFEVDQLRAQR